MTTTSIDAYDLPARVASYDADMDVMHPNRWKMIRTALEVLPLEPQTELNALELGTGTGAFTGAFLEHYPKASVVSIDGAASMIELARARLGPLAERVDFRVMDFRELSAKLHDLQPVQVVFTSYALHHLYAVAKLEVVRSASTFLEPGGWFLNADILIAESPDIEARIQELRVRGIVERAGGRDERFRDPAATRRFLDEMEAAEGDQPLTLREDLRILRGGGLRDATVFWQEYREAVYGARR